MTVTLSSQHTLVDKNFIVLCDGKHLLISLFITWDPSGFKSVNLLEQDSNPESTLDPYRKLVPLERSRRQFPLMFITRALALWDVLGILP